MQCVSSCAFLRKIVARIVRRRSAFVAVRDRCLFVVGQALCYHLFLALVLARQSGIRGTTFRVRGVDFFLTSCVVRSVDVVVRSFNDSEFGNRRFLATDIVFCRQFFSAFSFCSSTTELVGLHLRRWHFPHAFHVYFRDLDVQESVLPCTVCRIVSFLVRTSPKFEVR